MHSPVLQNIRHNQFYYDTLYTFPSQKVNRDQKGNVHKTQSNVAQNSFQLFYRYLCTCLQKAILLNCRLYVLFYKKQAQFIKITFYLCTISAFLNYIT
jgi:hypothetical protein